MADPRALAFYRNHGFEALGVHEVGRASHAHGDVVMSRAVPSGLVDVR
jgi:hypothetical protein